MSSIHFVGGEKGGTGKSVFSRLLCEWFLENSATVAALDTDLSQGSLKRAFGDLCQQVDLMSLESADQVMDRALGAERQVVVELASASLAHLGRWLTSGDVLAFSAELAVKLTYWHVTDGGFDSVQSLERARSLLGPETNYIVVRNHGCSSDFSQLDSSPTLKTLLAQGGQVIDLAKLEPRVMHAVDQTSGNFETLTPMQRQRLSLWKKHISAQLEPLLRPLTAPQDAELIPEVAEGAAAGTQAPEIVTPDAPDASPPATVPSPDPASPAVGTIINQGAQNWTEVGEDCLIHHVRCI